MQTCRCVGGMGLLMTVVSKLPSRDGRMKATKSNFRTRVKQLFLLAATLALVSTTAPAAGGRHKLAPDLSGFPVNSDGTVDVIIQFNQTPQARHFQMMASRGGRLRFSFKHINGAAYRIPARLLAWLEKHPHCAYGSPDQRNKTAWDDDIA